MAQILAVLIQISIALSVRLCGQGKVVGFWIGFSVQFMNVAYGLLTYTWGFLLGLVLVAPQFFLAARAWQRRARQNQALIIE